MSNEELLTATEVARLFRVAPQTVSRWAKEGTVPATKLPGRGAYRFLRRDIERLLPFDPEHAAS